MEVHIKNMVCDRCIKAVMAIFDRAGVQVDRVELGIVQLSADPGVEKSNGIKKELEQEGFEWLDDQKIKLVERIRQLIMQLVHRGGLDDLSVNLSDYLSATLHKEYHYLSSLFSSMENTTIEQYFILQKIEKVKEWLLYDELTLSEMAFRLGYSSVAHLSAQFKKVTGTTPSQFRQSKEQHRTPIDKL